MIIIGVDFTPSFSKLRGLIPTQESCRNDDCSIGLPQTLVTGTSKGEPSPLERVRRSRDVLTLRLFIDLYAAHHLQDDGGISRNVVRQEFSREKVFEWGIYIVWSFHAGSRQAWPHTITQPHWKKEEDGNIALWRRLDTLCQLGLVEFVPHLCEDNTADGEPIHPYGTDWSTAGRSEANELRRLENSIGWEAQLAAERIVGPNYTYGGFLAPISNDRPNVQMVGIARLRYRPHTKRTTRWLAVMLADIPGMIEQYRSLKGAEKCHDQGLSRVVKEDQGLSMGIK